LNEPGKTIVRLALFGAGVVVLAAVAAFAGRASGIKVENEPGDAMTHGAESAGVTANGLSDSASGFRFRLGSSPLRADGPARLDMTLERNGKPFTQLDDAHDEPPLHLILVRRDLAGYVHVHPRRNGDRFTATIELPTPGIWRAYADFEVDGEKIVLGRDQPYLGAAGHLVAIREDDLAYLHVHPLESSRSGTITFEAELEEPGRYALFFQFRHGGRVHTVPFTMVAT
jgi:hypothetical protein